MIDVREIKLNMRYPESRQEDITDAFTRGYTGAVEASNKAIKKLEAENAKLRELAGGMYGILATFDAILGNHDACETPRPLIFGENKSFKDVMRELGVEVGP